MSEHLASFHNLEQWLQLIERHNLLHRVSASVNPIEELSAITLLASQRGNSPALLFENLAGNNSDIRILTNILGSSKERFALTVGLDPSLSTKDMIAESRQLMKKKIPPIMVPKSSAPVNEIIETGNNIDLTRLPVPKFWPNDGGPYIGTANVTITRDHKTDVLNAGVYRQQLFNSNKVGLVMAPGRHGRRNCEAAWVQGRPAEVVVAYGMDPALFLAATQSFGPYESELDYAGGFMNGPVELTEAEFVSLPIPANAEFVIEGLVYPDEIEMEGPLGEFHGFYSGQAEPASIITVKAIHRRRRPILTAALMADYPSCEIGAYHVILRSARILDNLEKMGVPGVLGAYAHPAAASGYGFVVVSLKQAYPGHAAQVLALTAQCPAAVYATKWIVAVDEDVDPTDIDQVLWAITTRADPNTDIDILRNTFSFPSDSSLPPDARFYGSKALINACKPHRYLSELPQRSLLRRSTYDGVAHRWNELGFSGAAPSITHFHPE